MSSLFFKFLLVLACIIRAPLSVLLIVLKSLIPTLNKRIQFERQNFINTECCSFRRDQLCADYCFEVSSEGELEQVRPLIEYYLSENKRIEILFASPSVESKCLKMAGQYPHNIRVLRLPIASFFPFNFLFFQSIWQWVSAPKILFCRYDFFPELLVFKLLGKKIILLSGATKKPSWFKTQVHLFFDLIVAANSVEAENFKGENVKKKIFSFDFRIPRIFERVSKSQETLAQHSDLKKYLDFLAGIENSKKLILGSAWRSDLEILKSPGLEADINKGELHLLIVPHNLSRDSIESIKTFLAENLVSVKVSEISNDKFEFDYKPGIVILNKSGILCELYSKFTNTYVGGGYERSIHSVLEPFLSGNQVYVGPKVNRSTEYDFIKNLCPQEIHLLNNPESFYNLFKVVRTKTIDQSLRDSLRKNGKVEMMSIISEIEVC